jgi:type IV secretion system protein VirB6/type IV secretion system protein TrbL
VAKAKGVGMRDSTMARIGETTGGKIAAAIRANEALPVSDGPVEFEDDTLSKGHEAPDADSEIAAFRDRKT